VHRLAIFAYQYRQLLGNCAGEHALRTFIRNRDTQRNKDNPVSSDMVNTAKLLIFISSTTLLNKLKALFGDAVTSD